MKTKYEIIAVNNSDMTVDVSLLGLSATMFFNATEMAKAYGKLPKDFLRLKSTEEYIEEIKADSGKGNSHNEKLVKVIHGGAHQGTWLHTELAFEFAGWCSATFRRKLHKWVERRIEEEGLRRSSRLAARTGYAPMLDAIKEAEPAASDEHFIREANMLNKLVLGMTASEFKRENGVDEVRDALDAASVEGLDKLQAMNTALIEVGMRYEERRDLLNAWHARRQIALGADE